MPGQLVNNLKKIYLYSAALIEYAHKDVNTTHISSKELIRKLKDLSHVQCPTVNLPVSTNGQYTNITSIICWTDELGFVGGINKPKKIKCRSSDGQTYTQLLKGKDDMRQDAIMQQVFGILNDMLTEHKDTKKRHLNVRTYKVVPLTQQCGVLEWCSNSMPLSMYLLGDEQSGTVGAHERYHPDDIKAQDCRKKIHVRTSEIGVFICTYIVIS